VAQHLAGGATAQQVGVVDAVGTRRHRVDQGQQLAAGPVPASPLAQVDRRIGGLLDAEPLGQVAASSRPALATAWVSSKQLSSWSRVWQDPIENAPSRSGDTAAVVGAMLPGQRAFLILRSGTALRLAVVTCQEVYALGSAAVGGRRCFQDATTRRKPPMSLEAVAVVARAD
jgi:hypothetical protein